MNLCIPIHHQNKVYTSCIIDKPRGGVIADSVDEIRSTGEFGAMLKLISGCIKSIEDTEGNVISRTHEIEPIIRNATIITAESLAINMLSSVNDIGAEQILKCPRCKETKIYDGENSIHYSDLEIRNYFPEDPDKSQIIRIDLEEPVEIKSNGETLMSISNIDIRMPTINDGISGSMKYPGDTLRRQYAIYVSAIMAVNGDPVDMKFKNQWGMWVFERMYPSDMSIISSVLSSYGINKRMFMRCKCGKQYSHDIDLSDFFESGLQVT